MVSSLKSVRREGEVSMKRWTGELGSGLGLDLDLSLSLGLGFGEEEGEEDEEEEEETLCCSKYKGLTEPTSFFHKLLLEPELMGMGVGFASERLLIMKRATLMICIGPRFFLGRGGGVGMGLASPSPPIVFIALCRTWV